MNKQQFLESLNADYVYRNANSLANRIGLPTDTKASHKTCAIIYIIEQNLLMPADTYFHFEYGDNNRLIIKYP